MGGEGRPAKLVKVVAFDRRGRILSQGRSHVFIKMFYARIQSYVARTRADKISAMTYRLAHMVSSVYTIVP